MVVQVKSSRVESRQRTQLLRQSILCTLLKRNIISQRLVLLSEFRFHKLSIYEDHPSMVTMTDSNKRIPC